MIVQMLTIINAPMIATITTYSINPKLERMTTVAADLFVCESSPSPYSIKRNQGDFVSTPVKRGFSKLIYLLEDVKSEALNHFFRLPAILPP